MDGVRKSKQQVFVVPRTEHDATLRRFGNRRRQRLPFEIGEVFAAQSIVQMFRVRQARQARKLQLEARRARHEADCAGAGGGGGGAPDAADNEAEDDTGSAEADLDGGGAGDSAQTGR